MEASLSKRNATAADIVSGANHGRSRGSLRQTCLHFLNRSHSAERPRFLHFTQRLRELVLEYLAGRARRHCIEQNDLGRALVGSQLALEKIQEILGSGLRSLP